MMGWSYNTKNDTSLNEYISLYIIELFFNGFMNT